MKPPMPPKPAFAAANLALLAPAAVLLAHAALWPQGVWKSDEFFGFASWRRWGFAGEWLRLLHWGPRPFSEALIYVYWCAVRATGRPLLPLALSAAWAILFLFLAVALKPWRTPGRIARATILLALPALFLLAAPVEELFYRPYVALAYLPALGAACFATIRLAGPGLGERDGWIALAVALAAGATSVEHGAFLAAGLAPFLLVSAVRGPRSGRLVRVISAGAVAVAAFGVLVLFWTGRINSAREMFVDAPIAHRTGLDMRLALLALMREWLRPEGWSLGASALVKCMVFFAMRHCLAIAWPARPPRLALLGLLVGLAATAFLSAFGAYYNFGGLCCQRMASYRQAIFLLMVAAGAGFFRPVRPMQLAVPVLALAVMINIQPRMAAIGTEYGLAGARAAARRITFATGMAPGTAPLEYVIAPPGPLLKYASFPGGKYEFSSQTAWPVASPMMYFEKRRMWAHDYFPDGPGSAGH